MSDWTTTDLQNIFYRYPSHPPVRTTAAIARMLLLTGSQFACGGLYYWRSRSVGLGVVEVWLEPKVTKADPRDAEIQRLRGLVNEAWSEAYAQGYSDARGEFPEMSVAGWDDSNARKALEASK